MNNISFWERKYFWDNWDYAVIGSGITGLTASLFLKRKFPKASIAIFEKGLLPSGASTKNAGFACFGSVSEILDDLLTMPEKDVFQLVADRYAGLNELRQLLGDKNIDFRLTGGFEIFRKNELESYKECLGSLGYINAELVQVIGKQAFRDASNRISDFGFSDVDHILINELEGVVDTGLMMKNLIAMALAEGIHIFNGVEIKEFTEQSNSVVLDSNRGEIKANHLLIATNGFARELLPELDVESCRGQVLVTEEIPGLKVEGCFHHHKGYDYFRNVGNRILLGGGRHTDKEGEKTSEFGLSEGIQTYLENLLGEVILPDRKVKIEYRWSGIMGIGNSKSVILKKVNSRTVCAVRFGGMGVALGTKVGRDAADMF